MIAAAGSGERLGAGGPKAFVELAGRPLLAWSLAAFAAADATEAIVVAAPPGEERRVESLAGDAGVEVKVVAGGEHRSQSVANAVREVGGELAAVHDAARPLLTPELIEALADHLAREPEAAGVIAAAPVTDTIKQASEAGRVIGTPERGRLWSAQTPQLFRAPALREALEVPAAELAAATDEAMLLEARGGQIFLHETPHPNFKVTTQIDLAFAATLLADRG